MTIGSVDMKCKMCDGSGYVYKLRNCPACDGTGKDSVVLKEAVCPVPGCGLPPGDNAHARRKHVAGSVSTIKRGREKS